MLASSFECCLNWLQEVDVAVKAFDYKAMALLRVVLRRHPSTVEPTDQFIRGQVKAIIFTSILFRTAPVVIAISSMNPQPRRPLTD